MTRRKAIREAIRDQALAEGFDAVGFARPEAGARAGQALRAFLAAGRQGDMGWMDAKADRRADPAVLWPGVRSIVMVGQTYGDGGDPRANLDRPDRGAISVYAQGRDYHDVVKKRLKRLGSWIAARHACEVKVFVDTAPVMEKPLAAAAGLGWQGKHTNLVSQGFGSWLFLGAVFIALDLEPDPAEADHCGSCRACLDSCPTAAFPAPYQLDARRCLSYLTIEHRGPVPRAFRTAMGNRIYGCDDCLAACPWNKFARAASDPALLPRAELTAPRLADLAALDDAAFRALFAGSAVKRLGRDRFVANVLIAIGNSALPGLSPAAEARLADAAPLVRAMAVWALSRLLPRDALIGLAARHRPQELDVWVLDEWREAY